MYEENVLFDYNSNSEDTATDTDAVFIDYEVLGDTIYVNTHDALADYYNEHPEFLRSNSLLSENENVGTSDTLEFSTSTDSKLYTVETVGAPSSVAQQELAYLLDIRNILLLFLLIYFVITMYSKLKNTLISYTTKE